jgi:outer membrane protein assembly factor BamA
VLAFRSDVVRTLSGDVVPFYAQPTLGGSTTLRGFREQRFRDRDSLSATAEYRYGVWRFLDVALFVDAGQVYSDLCDEIGSRGFETAYGAGLRLNGPGNIMGRLSIGHSDEGTRLFLKFGPTW